MRRHVVTRLFTLWLSLSLAGPPSVWALREMQEPEGSAAWQELETALSPAGLEETGRPSGQKAGIPWGNPDAIAKLALEALVNQAEPYPREILLSKRGFVRLLTVKLPTLINVEKARPDLLSEINDALERHLPSFEVLTQAGVQSVKIEPGYGLGGPDAPTKLPWNQIEDVADLLLDSLYERGSLPEEIFLSKTVASKLLLGWDGALGVGDRRLMQLNSILDDRLLQHPLSTEHKVKLVRIVPRYDFMRQFPAKSTGEYPFAKGVDAVAQKVFSRMSTVESASLPEEIYLDPAKLAKLLEVTGEAVRVHIRSKETFLPSLNRAFVRQLEYFPALAKKGLKRFQVIQLLKVDFSEAAAGLEEVRHIWNGLRDQATLETNQVVVVGEESADERIKLLAGLEEGLLIHRLGDDNLYVELIEKSASVHYFGGLEETARFETKAKITRIPIISKNPPSAIETILLKFLTNLWVPPEAAAAGLEAVIKALDLAIKA
jgi:hypothetical protein